MTAAVRLGFPERRKIEFKIFQAIDPANRDLARSIVAVDSEGVLVPGLDAFIDIVLGRAASRIDVTVFCDENCSTGGLELVC